MRSVSSGACGHRDGENLLSKTERSSTYLGGIAPVDVGEAAGRRSGAR